MSDELDRWPAITRKIEPLPGGLEELRQRIRGGHRPRRRVALAAFGAAVTAAMVIALVMLRRDAEPTNRTAMHQLLSARHPEAIGLGLVGPEPAVIADDPRVSDSDVVIFHWVPPVTEPTRD